MTAVKNINTENLEEIGHLIFVKGGKRKRSTDQMIRNAWFFAQACLWEGQTFSEEEVESFKKLIEEFFEETEYSEEIFVEFCERVILTKRYVARSHYRYVAKPALWLNIHYKHGISSTEQWHRSVQEQRMTAPEYNLGMNILAVAVAMYTKDPSWGVYVASRNELIRLKQFDLLPVFNSMITAFHFLNH